MHSLHYALKEMNVNQIYDGELGVMSRPESLQNPRTTRWPERSRITKELLTH